jgi:hypothetical protein
LKPTDQHIDEFIANQSDRCQESTNHVFHIPVYWYWYCLISILIGLGTGQYWYLFIFVPAGIGTVAHHMWTFNNHQLDVKLGRSQSYRQNLSRHSEIFFVTIPRIFIVDCR